MGLDCLDGVLDCKMFHKPSKWNPAGVPFLIGRLEDGTMIKGEMRAPRLGERYRFWGQMRAQKKSPEPAFEFSTFEVVIDESEEGVAYYLRKYVDGLGYAKSKAVVDHFKADTLRVLRSEPERALEVPGITEKIVAAIRKHFEEGVTFDPAAYAALVDLFSEFRIPRKIIETLLKYWGSSAPQKVRDNPYMLLALPRMGWNSVDPFALTKCEYDPAGLERHKAAIVEALTRICSQGHTYAIRGEIEVEAWRLISDRPSGDAWLDAVADDLIVSERVGEAADVLLADYRIMRQDGSRVDSVVDHFLDLADVWVLDPQTPFALPKIHQAEIDLAARLRVLSEAAKPLPFSVESDRLNDDQREAARLIRQHGVVLLVGGPGTGKTWTVSGVIGELLRNGITRIQFVAPTGKAAKRGDELIRKNLEELAEIPCSTIHKALGPKPSDEPEDVPGSEAKIGRGRDEFAFGANEANPLDCEYLICDETSMVDVRLGASLLKALSPGTRLLIVGDHNQLPSVGPGSVLRDMIEAGLPTATLTKVQRNCGAIVRACHAIKDGRVPTPSPRLDLANGENWLHLEMSDPWQIARTIVDLHTSATKFDPMWEMQCVSPQKEIKGIGCASLNRMLSAALNPQPSTGDDDDDEEGFGPKFHIGDKVIRRKNGLCDEMVATPYGGHDDWEWDGRSWHFVETAIVNGDMGKVLAIIPDPGRRETWVVVRFITPHRLCRLPMSECHLSQAYAITCHSAQGSGFPYVIVPVHHQFYWDAKTQTGLWNRELVYTMFSRAERVLISVGQTSAIHAAVQRKTVHHRRTTLARRIRAAMPAAAPQPEPMPV